MKMNVTIALIDLKTNKQTTYVDKSEEEIL